MISTRFIVIMVIVLAIRMFILQRKSYVSPSNSNLSFTLACSMAESFVVSFQFVK